MAIINSGTSADSIADRNKSELTLRITEAANNWLANIGAKAVETEVSVANGWIADLAAFWTPTPTEAIKSKLIPPKPKRDQSFSEDLKKAPGFGDYCSARKEWWQEFRKFPMYISIVHEVKTSVADFKKDRKWTMPPAAHIMALSAPQGMLTPEDYPKNWWVLEHPEGEPNNYKIKQRASLNTISLEQNLIVVANIAERRHNRTAYAFLRDLQKSHRLQSQQNKLSSNLSRCMKAVLDIAKGDKPLEECLKYHFYNQEFSDSLMDKFKEVHGVLRKI